MMPKSKKILLLGAGGHCKSIIDTLFGLNIYEDIAIVEKKDVNSKHMLNEDILNIPIIGTDDDLEQLLSRGYKDAFISVGSFIDISIRKKLFNKIKTMGFNIPNIIDRTSIVSENAIIGEGNYVGKRAVINVNAKLSNCTIINTGSIVEHDCNIEPFVHLAPGSILCGNVFIGEGTHVGAGSIIKQGIHVGNNTMIGMGSVVVKDIGSNKKAFGNPCKEVHYE